MQSLLHSAHPALAIGVIEISLLLEMCETAISEDRWRRNAWYVVAVSLGSYVLRWGGIIAIWVGALRALLDATEAFWGPSLIQVAAAFACSILLIHWLSWICWIANQAHWIAYSRLRGRHTPVIVWLKSERSKGSLRWLAAQLRRKLGIKGRRAHKGAAKSKVAQ